MPETVVDMFFRNAERIAEKTALMVKEGGSYKNISYSELAETVSRFAYGLKKLGIKAGDHLAILSENRPEWAYADLAYLALGAVTIPIYPTLSSASD